MIFINKTWIFYRKILICWLKTDLSINYSSEYIDSSLIVDIIYICQSWFFDYYLIDISRTNSERKKYLFVI